MFQYLSFSKERLRWIHLCSCDHSKKDSKKRARRGPNEKKIKGVIALGLGGLDLNQVLEDVQSAVIRFEAFPTLLKLHF